MLVTAQFLRSRLKLVVLLLISVQSVGRNRIPENPSYPFTALSNKKSIDDVALKHFDTGRSNKFIPYKLRTHDHIIMIDIIMYTHKL
jgi:hypothetical protein